DPENWIEANIKLTEKWEGRFPQIGARVGEQQADWKARARRAESEAAAARTLRITTERQADARAKELQRELEIMRQSTSWRVTAPLRAVSSWLRARRSSER